MPGASRLHSPFRIQRLEHGQAQNLLGLEVVFRLVSTRHEAPSPLLTRRVLDVVSRPGFWFAQHAIRFRDHPEAARVTGFGIVRMKTLREETVHAMNRVQLSVGADLQGLVVIDGCFVV